MTEIPEPLSTAYRKWAQSGKNGQESFFWRPESWRKRFRDSDSLTDPNVSLLDSVETIVAKVDREIGGETPLINRGLVTSLHVPCVLRADDDSYDRQAVVTAFIASMIWGYGSTGYGPFRTERVLTATPDAVDALVHVAEIAQSPAQGGEAAFDEIAAQRAKSNRNHLKYLGPAFGTKFLYFLTAAAPGVEPTPVMDAIIRRWFRDEAGIRLNTWAWEKGGYGDYLGALDRWRAELSADADSVSREDLELLIFSLGRGDDFTGPATEQLVTAPEELDVDQLLDLLRDDIAEIAELSGSPDGPEILSSLAEWVETYENQQE